MIADRKVDVADYYLESCAVVWRNPGDSDCQCTGCGEGGRVICGWYWFRSIAVQVADEQVSVSPATAYPANG
ncbi:hypothetical protein [Chloroflexus aurantiacus]